MKKIIFLVLLIGISVVGILLWQYQKVEKPAIDINNFEECAKVGYPILESYPRQCKMPDGKTFTEDIGNELEKYDLIRVSTPRPNQTIESPLTIKGEARGFWFFEAVLPVKLLNDKGEELVVGYVQAANDWMTEDFVPFEGEINFISKVKGEGNLVFNKANPSGLAEHDEELWVPVQINPTETIKVKLYYYNQIKDKEIAEYIPCSPDAVLPVEREIPNTKTPIQDTIKQLFRGELTAQEKSAGFSTEFPLEGLELVGANLKNGILTLEFNDSLNKTSGGSCRVRLLWFQIEKTAKQFLNVEEVKFIPAWLFQP